MPPQERSGPDLHNAAGGACASLEPECGRNEEAIIKLYTLAGREASDGFRLQTLFAVQAADYPRPGSQADSGSEGWENQRVAVLGSCLEPDGAWV